MTLLNRSKMCMLVAVFILTHLSFTVPAKANEMEFTDDEINSHEPDICKSRNPATFTGKLVKAGVAACGVSASVCGAYWTKNHLQTTARVKEEAKSIFKEWQKYPDTTVAYSAYSDCGNDISAKEFSPIKLHELAIKKAWEREYDRRKMAERMTKSEAEKIANEKFKKDNSELFDSK